MNMLLWKDYRLSRMLLLAGLMLATAPYVIIGLAHEDLKTGWPASVYASQLAIGLLAGNIIACERADRSAEFLAFQGASRTGVLTSKAIICLLAYAVTCAAMILTGKLLLPPMVFQESWRFQLAAAATGLALWGCCWLLSSILESPVLAIILGAIGPMSIYAGLTALDSQFPKEDVFSNWYAAVCGFVGVATFASGSMLYLKRREP